MKTSIFATIIGVLLLNSSNVMAQENLPVKSFEVEVKTGTTYPLDNLVGSKRLGIQFGLEGRWNIKRSPFDVGAEAYMGAAFRHYQGEGMSHRLLSFSAFGDYNFLRGHTISLFIGVGVGVAACDNIKGSYGTEGTSALFIPRIGMEISRHLRLTLDARIARKGYNTIGLSIGYAFGGGRK